MKRNSFFIVKISFCIILVAVIIGYSLFEARNILKGPILSINNPINGSFVKEPMTEISGQVKNSSFISLNDRAIFIDKEGVFKEKILLQDGYNILTLKAKDKFGRLTTKNIEIVLKEDAPTESITLNRDSKKSETPKTLIGASALEAVIIP